MDPSDGYMKTCDPRPGSQSAASSPRSSPFRSHPSQSRGRGKHELGLLTTQGDNEFTAKDKTSHRCSQGRKTKCTATNQKATSVAPMLILGRERAAVESSTEHDYTVFLKHCWTSNFTKVECLNIKTPRSIFNMAPIHYRARFSHFLTLSERVMKLMAP